MFNRKQRKLQLELLRYDPKTIEAMLDKEEEQFREVNETETLQGSEIEMTKAQLLGRIEEQLNKMDQDDAEDEALEEGYKEALEKQFNELFLHNKTFSEELNKIIREWVSSERNTTFLIEMTKKDSSGNLQIHTSEVAYADKKEEKKNAE